MLLLESCHGPGPNGYFANSSQVSEAADRHRAAFSASPNPITVADGSKAGITRLSWDSKASNPVEIHVGKPDGILLCRRAGSGFCDTGKWVTDGMTFYLQDASSLKPTDPAATLATLVVRVY